MALRDHFGEGYLFIDYAFFLLFIEDTVTFNYPKLYSLINPDTLTNTARTFLYSDSVVNSDRMVDWRQRFIEFPWIPSLVVSLLAGLIFYLIENPKLVPDSLQTLIFSAIQYGVFLTALLAFAISLISLFFISRQKSRWEQIKRELASDSNNDARDSEEIIQTPNELLVNRIDDIEGLVWISDDGDISITRGELSDPQKIILYLIAARYAYELDLVDSPKIGGVEICNNVNIPYQSLIGWQLPLEDVVVKHHYDIWDGKLNEYEIRLENIDEAIDYVTGERELPEGNLLTKHVSEGE